MININSKGVVFKDPITGTIDNIRDRKNASRDID